MQELKIMLWIIIWMLAALLGATLGSLNHHDSKHCPNTMQH